MIAIRKENMIGRNNHIGMKGNEEAYVLARQELYRLFIGIGHFLVITKSQLIKAY